MSSGIFFNATRDLSGVTLYICAEIDVLEANRTWTLTQLLPSKKVISYKWVYKIKYNSNGLVERHKVWLVVTPKGWPKW
jgi:hypothetical protein